MNLETYRFPINAALNDSKNGFLEFKKDDGIYLVRPNDKTSRRILASKVGHDPVLPNQRLSKILDLRSVRAMVEKNQDARYLVVMIKDNAVTLTID